MQCSINTAMFDTIWCIIASLTASHTVFVYSGVTSWTMKQVCCRPEACPVTQPTVLNHWGKYWPQAQKFSNECRCSWSVDWLVAVYSGTAMPVSRSSWQLENSDYYTEHVDRLFNWPDFPELFPLGLGLTTSFQMALLVVEFAGVELSQTKWY